VYKIYFRFLYIYEYYYYVYEILLFVNLQETEIYFYGNRLYSCFVLEVQCNVAYFCITDRERFRCIVSEIEIGGHIEKNHAIGPRKMWAKNATFIDICYFLLFPNPTPKIKLHIKFYIQFTFPLSTAPDLDPRNRSCPRRIEPFWEIYRLVCQYGDFLSRWQTLWSKSNHV
jgi:hypothetical protein